MAAFRVTSRLSDLVADSGAVTISAGTSGSGDLVVETDTTERFRVTNAGVVSFDFGDSQSGKGQLAISDLGSLINIRKGYAASGQEDTSLVPPIRISRTIKNTGGITGDGAEQLAGISVTVRAVHGTTTQPVGGFFAAINDSSAGTPLGAISPDACGVYGVGKILSGGAGVAAGACFIGDKESGSTGIVTSQQNFSFNYTGVDSTYSPTGGQDCAFWVQAGGTGNTAAAILIAGYGGKKFDVGLGFMGTSGAANGIVTASIRDDSSAVTSYDIRGTHSAGIDLSNGTFSSSAVNIGNNKPLAGKTAGGTTANLLKVKSGSGVELGSSTFGSIIIPNNTVLAGYDAAVSTAYAIGYVSAADVVHLGDPAIATSIAGATVTATGEILANFGVTMDNTKALIGKSTGGSNLNIGKVDGADSVILGDASATTISFGKSLTLAAQNIATDTTTGMKLATSTSQKLGFFNATPIVQPSSTTDLRTALINLGLYASGGASPLDLNGGTLTAAIGAFGTSPAQTGALRVPNQSYIYARNTAGTADLPLIAINASDRIVFGTTMQYGEAQNIVLGTTTGTYIGSATNQKLGFYGTTPVVQGGATTDLGTILSNLGLRAAGTAYPITTSGALTLTGTVNITDVNVVLGTTTGTKFGTGTTQKLSFYNSTPIVQPSAVGSGTGYSDSGATVVHSAGTWTGNTGSTAYTVNGIVAALKNLGLIAA